MHETLNCEWREVQRLTNSTLPHRYISWTPRKKQEAYINKIAKMPVED